MDARRSVLDAQLRLVCRHEQLFSDSDSPGHVPIQLYVRPFVEIIDGQLLDWLQIIKVVLLVSWIMDTVGVLRFN